MYSIIHIYLYLLIHIYLYLLIHIYLYLRIHIYLYLLVGFNNWHETEKEDTFLTNKSMNDVDNPFGGYPISYKASEQLLVPNVFTS